jgi:hypothetical protein
LIFSHTFDGPDLYGALSFFETMPSRPKLTNRSKHSSRLLEAFHQGLKDRGFVEGHNVKIEYRFAHNQNERLPALATDLVQRQVTAIVSMAGTPGALAAKAATKVIPIVFQAGADMTFCGANVRFMTQSVHWSLRSWDWMTAMLVRRCVWLS